ncbi:MAG: PAS domain-containing protein [Alphaproteobacteria bacterium]|nr:PAS domain-containing protein [Alphaproteobacteria bacterium]
MSLAEFFARLESPALRQIAAHWRDARGGRMMPGWKHIDPVAIAPHLPIVWAWRYDRAADRFIGRLAGDAITAAFERQMRGATLHEFFAGRDPDEAERRYRRIVGEPALMHCQGQVFRHAGRVGVGGRIGLPLAEDGEHADGILGATTYSLPSGLYRDGVRGERFAQQHCVFFPLRNIMGGIPVDGRPGADRG